MKDTDVSVTESACTSKAETSVATETATETETETTITESRTLPLPSQPTIGMTEIITEKVDSQLRLRVDSNQSKIEEYELMTKVNLSSSGQSNQHLFSWWKIASDV